MKGNDMLCWRREVVEEEEKGKLVEKRCFVSLFRSTVQAVVLAAFAPRGTEIGDKDFFFWS